MSTTTSPIYNSMIAKTNEWLRDIQNELDWPDPEKAFKALRVVLHTLRDRLPLKEVTDLSAQLPMLVRGLYFEGWNPLRSPSRIKHIDEFTHQVNSHFPEFEYAEPQEITRAVLTTLSNHVSAGEIEDVMGCLPKELRELWS